MSPWGSIVYRTELNKFHLDSIFTVARNKTENASNQNAVLHISYWLEAGGSCIILPLTSIQITLKIKLDSSRICYIALLIYVS